MPEALIQEYMKNGTNLICPKGTKSERSSSCLGQCIINLANKEIISVLNPVTDVIQITSVSEKESMIEDELGSLAERLATGKTNRRL